MWGGAILSDRPGFESWLCYGLTLYSRLCTTFSDVVKIQSKVLSAAVPNLGGSRALQVGCFGGVDPQPASPQTCWPVEEIDINQTNTPVYECIG